MEGSINQIIEFLNKNKCSPVSIIALCDLMRKTGLFVFSPNTNYFVEECTVDLLDEMLNSENQNHIDSVKQFFSRKTEINHWKQESFFTLAVRKGYVNLVIIMCECYEKIEPWHISKHVYFCPYRAALNIEDTDTRLQMLEILEKVGCNKYAECYDIRVDINPSTYLRIHGLT